ncbi:MAG TPA: hypothetical protein VMV91_10860 [Rhodocyclaceae bacterium]|nr:hypothetical protein [Rhodocyclaceae bacterium]
MNRIYRLLLRRCALALALLLVTAQVAGAVAVVCVGCQMPSGDVRAAGDGCGTHRFHRTAACAMSHVSGDQALAGGAQPWLAALPTVTVSPSLFTPAGSDVRLLAQVQRGSPPLHLLFHRLRN